MSELRHATIPEILERLAQFVEAPCPSTKHTYAEEWLRFCDPAHLRILAAALTPPAPASDWERIEIPFTFSGRTVGIPALRDPSDGERFYSPDAVQIMYNLEHALKSETP